LRDTCFTFSPIKTQSKPPPPPTFYRSLPIPFLTRIVPPLFWASVLSLGEKAPSLGHSRSFLAADPIVFISPLYRSRTWRARPSRLCRVDISPPLSEIKKSPLLLCNLSFASPLGRTCLKLFLQLPQPPPLSRFPEQKKFPRGNQPTPLTFCPPLLVWIHLFKFFDPPTRICNVQVEARCNRY